jgi:glycosyltransferase involved in cell wall biosynthesis
MDFPITSGGGFNQALNALDQMARLCRGRHELSVFTSMRANQGYLERLGYPTQTYRLGPTDMWLINSAGHQVSRKLQNRLKRVGSLERRMLDSGADLAYFLIPNVRALVLQKLNFIATFFDVAHRDCPEFPELARFGVYAEREHLYRSVLGQALVSLCDSPQLFKRLQMLYGLDSDRLLAMPFAPSPFLAEADSVAVAAVLDRYRLAAGYYLYPAQLWPHKNHIRLIEALGILRDQGHHLTVVFSGHDHGNLGHLRAQVQAAGMGNQVKFLGFVPEFHMRGLYEGAAALVMPTYLGPTNLPPLEAWSVGCPVIYSSTCAEQAGDAALLADPDSAAAWAQAMLEVARPEVATNLIHRGTARLAQLNADRARAELQLVALLDRYETRQRAWS